MELEAFEAAGCELSAEVVAGKRGVEASGVDPVNAWVAEDVAAAKDGTGLPAEERVAAGVAKENPGDGDAADAGCDIVLVACCKLREKLEAGVVKDEAGADAAAVLGNTCAAAVDV